MARLSERLGPNETFWPARQERKDALNEAISVWQALTGEWTTQIAISGKSKNRNFYPTPRQIVSITRITTAAGTDSTAETLINEIDPILAMEFRLVGAEGWEQGLYDSTLTGLLAYWPMTEPAGSTRAKSLGSLTGVDFLEDNGPIPTQSGKFGGLAPYSDPIPYSAFGPYQTLKTGTFGPVDLSSSGFTVACWVYLNPQNSNSLNTYSRAFEFYDGSYFRCQAANYPKNYGGRTDGDQLMAVQFVGATGTYHSTSGSLWKLDFYRWYLVTAWANPDGTCYAQLDNADPVAPATPLDPGTEFPMKFTNAYTFRGHYPLADPAWTALNGAVGPMMLWNRVLTSGERTQLWSGGKKPHWEAWTVPGATVVWNSIPSGGQEPYSYSWSIAPDDSGLTPFTSTEVAPYQLIPSYGGDWTATLVTTDAAGTSYTATFPFVVVVADPPTINSVTQGCATPPTFLWNVTNVSISDGSGNYTYSWRLYEGGDESTGDLVGTSSAALPSIDFSGAPAFGVICSGRFYLDLYDVTLGVHAYYDGVVDCNCS